MDDGGHPRRRYAVGTFVAFILLWSLLAILIRPESTGSPVLLPPPWVVVRDLYVLFLEEAFIGDVLFSVLRIVLGVFAAAVPAFFLGLWFGTRPAVFAGATPLFAFVKYIPPVSFIPVLILWFGIGLQQQVALLFVGVFFYLTMMIAETVASTPPAYRDASRTLGLQGSKVLWRVDIPHALPQLIEHLRVMVGIAWTYLVVAEMVAAPNGIGRVIINSQRYLQTGRVFAGMLMIGLLGVVFDLSLRSVRKRICAWAE